jgi:hypothetical protein
MSRLPPSILGLLSAGMGLQAFGELLRAESHLDAEVRAERAARTGMGTGKCACGKRISHNKSACLACSEEGKA